MSELVRLARTLEAAARDWSEIELGSGGGVAMVELLGTGSPAPGVAPSVAGFRIVLLPGPFRDHELTVTITEKRG